MIQHPRVERTTVHAARRYGHTLYVSVRRRLSTLIAVEGKCTDSSCREIGAVPGRAPRGGYRSNGYRGTGRPTTRPRGTPRAGYRVLEQTPSTRKSVAEYYTAQSTAPPVSPRGPHHSLRCSATDQRGLRRPPTQDKTLTNHSNHQARSPRHKQASPRGTNHRHKASSHPHVAISSSNRRARPRAESPTPHLNLAMLLHGGITASRSS